MSGRKVRESNINLEECNKLVRQSGAKGISATELKRKMGKDRSTIYDYLNTLEMRERVQSSHGLWFSKPENPANDTKANNQSSEKEIVIELPIPKNQWYRIAVLEAHANRMERLGISGVAQTERIIVERFNETRRIRITGKNVDHVDLEKIGNLIQQANRKSSLFNLKGIFKGLKKSLPDDSTLKSEKV